MAGRAAVWAESFAQIGAPAPTPLDIIASHHGTAQAVSLTEAFSAGAAQTASRIWLLRPDLSYLPN